MRQLKPFYFYILAYFTILSIPNSQSPITNPQSPILNPLVKIVQKESKCRKIKDRNTEGLTKNLAKVIYLWLVSQV